MASPCAAEPLYEELKPTSDETIVGVNSLLVAGPPQVPVIDLSGALAEGEPRRREAVEQIRSAAAAWGVFQIVGHGVPRHLLDEMLTATRSFHEGDADEKAAYFSPDGSRSVQFTSMQNRNLPYDPNWRDSLFCRAAPHPPRPDELPAVFRGPVLEYSKHIARLGTALFELLAEALGLRPSHFKDMECDKGNFIALHLYPTCPQADVILGSIAHTDADFATIILQDDIGGLQGLVQGQWVDVPPTPGALVVQLGDLMQLVTNDRFKTAEHRVLGNKDKARVSVGCFFTTDVSLSATKLYGPMKELMSQDELPKYRPVLVSEYSRQYAAGLASGDPRTLPHFML